MKITHDEAREDAKILNDFNNNHGGLNQAYLELLKYINQQEHNENVMLDLYKDQENKIKELENEL